VAMLTDMGGPLDATMIGAGFRAWLRDLMPSGAYRAWLVESVPGGESATNASAREIVAGGGATIIPWPPGPRYSGSKLAFVYNVYTEAAHRRRGLAKLVMDTIHRWCAANGVTSVALNASAEGRRLY